MRKWMVVMAAVGLAMGMQARAEDPAPAVPATPAAVSVEDLAKETEAYCASTATTKATPAMVKEMVDKAVALVEKEGAACFPKFKGKGSEFIFAGTYLWINSLEGVMLMHPVKPKMENKDCLAIKDMNGKALFADFIDEVKAHGQGWVEYVWPKPGEKAPSPKISYVKKAKCDGKDVLVGCGIYDVPADEMAKLVAE